MGKGKSITLLAGAPEKAGLSSDSRQGAPRPLFPAKRALAPRGFHGVKQRLLHPWLRCSWSAGNKKPWRLGRREAAHPGQRGLPAAKQPSCAWGDPHLCTRGGHEPTPRHLGLVGPGAAARLQRTKRSIRVSRPCWLQPGDGTDRLMLTPPKGGAEQRNSLPLPWVTSWGGGPGSRLISSQWLDDHASLGLQCPAPCPGPQPSSASVHREVSIALISPEG